MKIKNKILTFLSLAISSQSLFGQWNIDPTINTPVGIATNNQQDARIVTDTKKGAIISWEDYRNNTAASDIYAQRLDGNGYAMWTANGIAVCNDGTSQTGAVITEDGNGGAIIVWNDMRNGTKDIYAQRIDSTGNLLWTANGISVCTKNFTQQNPKVMLDGTGGAFVFWEDSVNGNWDIFAQRISATGSLMWNSSGVVICNVADSQINPKVKTDGASGAIVCWQDKRNSLEYHVYAQRIDASGTVQWTANGINVCTNGGGQTNPKIEPDGANGGIIAWQDNRNGNYDVYAQRINGNGALQWTSTGIAICNYPGAQSAIDITTDLVNGAIISWKDVRNGVYQVYATLVSLTGATQWASNGILIANGINPNIVGDGSGGAIITWQDSTTTSGNWNVYSQRLNSSGTKLWTTTGVAVATAMGSQTSPKNIGTGDGGCIYTWQDKRLTGNLDIYAHKLDASGGGVATSVSEISTLYSSSIYPNPFSKSAVITLEAPINKADLIELQIYDMTGKFISSQKISITANIVVNKNELSSGIYFYKINSGCAELTHGKFIIE